MTGATVLRRENTHRRNGRLKPSAATLRAKSNAGYGARLIASILRTLTSRDFIAIARLCLATVILSLGSSVAHAIAEGTTYFATVSVNKRSVRFEMALPSAVTSPGPADRTDRQVDAQTIDTLLLAIDNKIQIFTDSGPCSAGSGWKSVTVPGNPDMRISLNFECPAPTSKLEIRYDLFDALGKEHRTLALLVWPGGTQQFMFGADQQKCRLDLLRGTVNSASTNFLRLGIERTLIGWVHLLFLLCLLLPAKSRSYSLQIAGAFAVAHGISLLAAGSGLISLPARLADAMIALSIIYVASENLILRGRIIGKRWMVAFLFGLIHGIGLSLPLSQTAMPMDDAVRSLLGFYAGVETGLGIFLGLLMPLLLWMRRNRWEAQATIAISALALALGISLFVARLLS